ncbi:hypothetical protein ACFLZ1_01235 [Patescibacteria group bacterium]
MVILSKTILILEDDLKTVSKLIKKLSILEQEQSYDLSIMVMMNYKQVEDYINNNKKAEFDIIILDRDCKLGRSFHVLDIERFGPKKIISISSVPKYNKEAKKRGVKKVILKDFRNLDNFIDKVVKEVEKKLRKMSLINSIKKLYKKS